MELRIIFKLLPHPYINDSNSINEIWANFSLSIFDLNGELVHNLFYIEWDILVFLSWIIENKHSLIEEHFPILINDDSLAKSIFSYYKNSDVDTMDDVVDESIYNFRTRHGIRFALRGTNIEDIYIGPFNDKKTISYCDDDIGWQYDIDLVNFIAEVERIYDEIKG